MRPRLAITAAVVAVAAAVVVAPHARADVMGGSTPEFVTAAPPAMDDVRVDEKLGAQVPLDLRFRDHTGQLVTLGDLVRGDLPVILTFNYSSCPMLCSLQLNGFVSSLPAVDLTAGEQFRIVTVVLEPKEEPARAAETRTAYLDKLNELNRRLRGPAERGGWTFLVAESADEDAAIRRLADTVGFGYRYLPERAEWAHPATLVFLSPSGIVTRYVHGIEYDGGELFASIVRAGTAEPSASVGFVQRCFHWDPDRNSKAAAGASLMRYGAAMFAAFLIGALALVHLLRRERASSGVARS